MSFLTQGVHPRQLEEIRDFDKISMKFCQEFEILTVNENQQLNQIDQSKSPFLAGTLCHWLRRQQRIRMESEGCDSSRKVLASRATRVKASSAASRVWYQHNLPPLLARGAG